MPIRELRRTQWIPRPVEEVFPFFADEKNLETITPPWLGFQVTGKSTETLRVGTLIDYRLWMRGVPLRWRTLIETWEPNRSFTDTQLIGPYKLWHHTHTFAPKDGGTQMDDIVRYELPLGRFGDTIAGWWVKRDVERIFDYRRDTIEKLFAK